jgi:hypothetical protein
MALHPKNIDMIREKLTQYKIERINFVEKPSNVPSYPNYDITGYIDGYHIHLVLLSCVFDKKANILGMKLHPNDVRDETVSFHLSILNDDLAFITPSLDINLIKDKSSMVDDINNSIPFSTNMLIAMFYESFTFFSGTFVYKNECYEIEKFNENPIFNLGFYAQEKNPKYYSRGIPLFRILQKNNEFYSASLNGLDTDLSFLKSKIFEPFFVYHMEKKKMQMDIMPMEELFSMKYEDIIDYIKVQQMVDI